MTRPIALVALLVAGLFVGQAAAQGPAKDFSLKTLDGKTVALKDLRGTVVLVNFWATWCIPCKVEIPVLMDLQKTYGPKGFTVLGISVDDEGAEVVKPWLQKNLFELDGKKQPVNFPILLSSTQFADEYDAIFAFPTTYLVDRKGNVVKHIEGPVEEKDITEAVRGLVEGR
ncbi:MAG: TlpA disulfide reductase family protein [Vicinamibacterales bacterium]